MITGLYSHHSHLAQVAKETVGLQDGVKHFATMHMVSLKDSPLFLADTTINYHLDKMPLVDIAVMASERVRCFGIDPVIALVSFSDFGSGHCWTNS